MPRLLFVGKCRGPRAYCYVNKYDLLKRERNSDRRRRKQRSKVLGRARGDGWLWESKGGIAFGHGKCSSSTLRRE